MEDTDTLTGVTFVGQNKPVVVSLLRRWKKSAADEAADGAVADELPCHVVASAAGGGTELLQCTVCDRLFATVHRYGAHACVEPVAASVLARGCALTVERAPYTARGGPTCGG
jgi:hypothetical protein